MILQVRLQEIGREPYQDLPAPEPHSGVHMSLQKMPQ